MTKNKCIFIGNYSVFANDTIQCVIANRSLTRHPPTRSERHQLQTRSPKMPPWRRHDEDMTKGWMTKNGRICHRELQCCQAQCNSMRSPFVLDATSTDAIWTTPTLDEQTKNGPVAQTKKYWQFYETICIAINSVLGDFILHNAHLSMRAWIRFHIAMQFCVVSWHIQSAMKRTWIASAAT